jgi:2-C-methyl-D-erythritol 4-phosphate cytidylyltransferase
VPPRAAGPIALGRHSPPEVGVLLPAAGSGVRAGVGGLKQFRPICGIPMLLRALRPFIEHVLVRHIVVALPPDVLARPPAWLLGAAPGRLRLVAGGGTRAASVGAALTALDEACRIVLVHDAARPFVSTETIDAVIAAAMSGHGAIAAVPLGDSLKRASSDGEEVAETIDRTHLWRAQTPQGFPRALLEQAYARRSHSATDDAELVERLGARIRIIWDRTTNIKVTTPDDFRLAEALAGQ